MKTAIYTLGLALFLSLISCRSVQSLVDSGDYDAAIALATKKMRGDKKKKTKHIKYLEKAFFKINGNDLEEISILKEVGDLDAYERILDLGQNIAYRQNLIIPYLPLVSKDGYVGHFEMVNSNSIINEAGNRIKTLSFEKGKEYLKLAKETHDKGYARDAYYAFLRVGDFDEDFKDVRALTALSSSLGVNHVLIETLFDNDLFLPRDITHYLDQVRYVPGSDKWTLYYDNVHARESFDFIARLKIIDIDISPEKERKRIFFEEKEIEDGQEYVLDKNGNVAKDTLGNDITRPKYSFIKARIKEIIREKSLGIRGEMELFETERGITQSLPISAEAIFEDLACIVRGDRRALSERTRKRVKDYPLEFPSDLELLLQTGDEIKQAFRYELDRLMKRISV
jgi:hypothetical protein